MRFKLFLLAPLVLLASAQAIGAQGRINDLSAFYALLYTPVGALPTIAHLRMKADSASRVGLDLRYGRYSFRDDTLAFNNIGVGGRLRAFRGVSVGGTFAHRSCGGGCEGLTMASVDAEATLLHRTASEPGGGDSEIGMALSAGYGKPSKAKFTATSFSVTLPLTITIPQENAGLVALSLLPTAAYGRLVDDVGVVFATIDTTGALVPGPVGSFGSSRFILGASIGYQSPRGLSIHGSVHRIVIRESTPQSGIVLSWRF